MASVYRRKSDGRWCAAETIGRQRVVRYAPKADNTRRAARDLARELERLRKAKAPVPAHRLTTAEHLRSWLRDADLAPNTRRRYSVIVEKHLIPAVGSIRLQALAVEDVQRLLNEAVGGPQSRRHYRAALRTALNVALDRGLIARNPAAARSLALPDLPEREPAYLTAEQARVLIAGTVEDRLHALYVLGLYTGLRQAEALGLTWQDVDLAAGLVTVRATLQRIDGAWKRRAGHKTSRRTGQWTKVVPIAGPARDALAEHYRRQQTEAAAAKSWPAYALVFTTERGTELYGWRVTRMLYAHEARLGLPRVGYHGLRHTTATLLLEAGIDRKIVAAMLGHTDSRTTENLYQHVRAEVARDAADALERVLSEATATDSRYTTGEDERR